MAQRAADVARREAALAASEGPAADLAARLRAADERIFEQRAEMATIELDARYQVERARARGLGGPLRPRPVRKGS